MEGGKLKVFCWLSLTRVWHNVRYVTQVWRNYLSTKYITNFLKNVWESLKNLYCNAKTVPNLYIVGKKYFRNTCTHNWKYVYNILIWIIYNFLRSLTFNFYHLLIKSFFLWFSSLFEKNARILSVSKLYRMFLPYK